MVTALQVKELRNITGAAMMDCKKALQESNGELEAARDWLRKKGLSIAAKKTGRSTTEGLIGIRVAGSKGAIVEVNSETDFVASNDSFQKLVCDISKIALEQDNVSSLKDAKDTSGKSITENINEVIASTGENLTLRRASLLEVSPGIVSAYLHNSLVENLGKIGVILSIKSSSDITKLQEIGKKIAMHIAASKPLSLSKDDLDPKLIEHEKEIFRSQAIASGKPENIVEKMVNGRIARFCSESVLLEQAFIMDTTIKVKDLLSNFAKENNTQISIEGFYRFEVGEGIVVEKQDFASEVQSLIK